MVRVFNIVFSNPSREKTKHFSSRFFLENAELLFAGINRLNGIFLENNISIWTKPTRGVKKR